MQIKAEKWKFNGTESYKILEINRCCDRIMDSQSITLNSEYEYDGISDDYECYEYSVKLFRIEDFDEFSETFYEKIRFCPFCGKKIDIEIVQEIDKNEEHRKLSEERKKLWDEHYKTDSKKKEKELSEKVRHIDKIINDMYESDSLEEIMEE